MDQLSEPPCLLPLLALIRVAALAPVVAFLRRAGAPVDRLLANASLPAFVFRSPEALIPLRQAVRFMEESARGSGIENLGLLAGRDTPIAALGVFGRLLRRCLSLGEAIETAMRTMPFFDSGSRYVLSGEGTSVRLNHEFIDQYAAGYRQAHEYFATISLNLVRLAVEPRRAEDDCDARLETSDGRASVVFPQSLLQRPLGLPRGGRLIDVREVEAWEASAPAADFPGSVLQVIRTLSSPTSPRIRQTADAIGLSVRGLQRRLAETGLAYERLVLQARFGKAVHLLQETNATVLDVALDAGYSDHAHFTRAFRRWTGLSPREFRRMQRSAEASANGRQRRVGWDAAMICTRGAKPRSIVSARDVSASSDSELTARQQPRL